MSEDNILKDPDFLFTLLAAVMKRDGGTLELTEDDILSVDMSEAVALHYDRTTGTVILKFLSAKEIFNRQRAVDHLQEKIDAATPRLKLVPELEDDEDE